MIGKNIHGTYVICRKKEQRSDLDRVTYLLLEGAGEEVANGGNEVDDLGFSGIAFKEVLGVVSNKLAHSARLAGLSGLGQGRTEAQEHGKNNKGSSHLKVWTVKCLH